MVNSNLIFFVRLARKQVGQEVFYLIATNRKIRKYICTFVFLIYNIPKCLSFHYTGHLICLVLNFVVLIYLLIDYRNYNSHISFNKYPITVKCLNYFIISLFFWLMKFIFQVKHFLSVLKRQFFVWTQKSCICCI